MKLSNYPNELPAITLDFLNSRQLDPRISFTRASDASPPVPSPGTGTHNGEVYLYPGNVPRLTDQGLLIEEGRTNLFEYSIPVLGSNGWGTDSNGTSTPNDTVAPDGTTTGTLITQTNAVKVKRAQTIVKDKTYTLSAFIKPSTQCTNFALTSSNYQQLFSMEFDSTKTGIDGDGVQKAGSSQQCTGTMDKSYDNGWIRISMTYKYTGNNGSGGNQQIRNIDAVSGTWHVWGAQFEEGGHFTSYIPTTGSTVTRAPDQVALNGEDFTAWYGDNTAGSVVVKVDIPLTTSEDQSFYQMAYNNGASNAGTNIKINANNQIRLNSRVNPAGQRDQLNVPDTDTVNKFANVKPLKLAGSYSTTATRLTCNAPFPFESGNSSVGADTTLPILLNLGWSQFGGDGQYLNGHLRSIQFYNTAFTEEQLELLAS